MRKEIQEWIEKGNRTEAVRLLEEWVGKHPADEEEWLLLGELLYADGKMTEALNTPTLASRYCIFPPFRLI